VLVAAAVPHIELSKDYITALVAVLGTTISPYLFFWQASSEVDEMRAAGQISESQRRGVRIQELNAARLDVVIGMLFSNAVMFFIVLTSAAVLHAHGKTSIDSAAAAAAALQPFAGRFATVLFAAGMIGTGLLAVPILSGSAAYALKEFLGLPGNLADKPRYRPTFYAVIVLSVAAGVAMNLLHIDAIAALFWTAVINGLVAPPLLFLIVILGADKKVMGRHASGRLSKVLTGAATLLMTVAALAMILTTWVIR
jgi:Mn2+/Fe2+ NRAMP family transporter